MLENGSQNSGFIIVGYPRTQQQAKDFLAQVWLLIIVVKLKFSLFAVVPFKFSLKLPTKYEDELLIFN